MPETQQIERPARRGRPPKSMALTTTTRRLDLSRRYLPTPAGADLRRWFLYEGQGMSVIDIAAREKSTSPEIVQASIDYIKEYMFRHGSLQLLNAKTIQGAMERLDDVNVALKGALKAKKVVHVDRQTGKLTQVEDHATRLKAAAENRATIEMMQPRQPGAIINQQFNTAVSGMGGGGGMSFESVLRRKRESRGLLNEQETEIIEAEVSQEEQIAEEFKDFGGDEEEPEEEDEGEEPDESST